jgi:predicted transcriptional regulator
MAKSHTFGIRLDPVVKATLERLAEQDKRSMSSLANKILAEYAEANAGVLKTCHEDVRQVVRLLRSPVHP